MVSAAGPVRLLPLPDEVPDALADAPVWEKRIVELALDWPGLSSAQARVAGRLRVFLLTWDPFEWRVGRPTAFATTTSRADGFGLVLYLPLWQALAQAASDIDGLAGLLGRFGESVVSVATEHEAAMEAGGYPEGVLADAIPDLLSRVGTKRALSLPSIRSVGDGWQPIQFDVLEDLAQEIFGPADLDRSPVVFGEPGDKVAGCPGCVGVSLTFPDGLNEAQATICSVHRSEALKVTTARLDRARASNPAGWEALLEAGQRLGEPHLPNGLGPRLVAAAATASPTITELQAQVALVLEAASLVTGLPHPQTALGAQLEGVRTWLQAFPEIVASRAVEEPSRAGEDESREEPSRAGELPRLDEPRLDERAVTDAVAVLLASAPAAAPADLTAAESEVDEPAAPPKQEPIRVVRISRNGPCPCRSGKKYKYCCGR